MRGLQEIAHLCRHVARLVMELINNIPRVGANRDAANALRREINHLQHRLSEIMLDDEFDDMLRKLAPGERVRVTQFLTQVREVVDTDARRVFDEDRANWFHRVSEAKRIELALANISQDLTRISTQLTTMETEILDAMLRRLIEQTSHLSLQLPTRTQPRSNNRVFLAEQVTTLLEELRAAQAVAATEARGAASDIYKSIGAFHARLMEATNADKFLEASANALRQRPRTGRPARPAAAGGVNPVPAAHPPAPAPRAAALGVEAPAVIHQPGWIWRAMSAVRSFFVPN